MNHLRKALVGLSFLVASAHASADINVGVILSLTGPAASLGIASKAAVDLWPKEVAGQKVNVILLDDASDTTAATLAARRLTQEHKVDILIGPSVTPTSLAVLPILGETKTPMISLGGGGSLVSPQEGDRRWVFKLPPAEEIPVRMIMERMKKQKEQKLAIVAMSNAFGQTWIDVAQKMAPEFGIKITTVERFNATDTSFVSQALKLLSTKPDAVFIAAAGTPAALPHIEIKNKGFRGTIYQQQAVANNDFLRVGGKAIEGTVLAASPLLVAEQLPDSNPIKSIAMAFVNKFEGKYGPGSRTLFGAMAWDAFLVMEKAATMALKDVKPGTPQFRLALRDAMENLKELPIAEGIYSMSPTDHNGADSRSQVLVKIESGKWRYLN